MNILGLCLDIADGADAPSEDELVAFTTARLASYKKPQRIHFVTELPRNASGKVLKRTLRDTFTGSEVTS